MDPRTRMRYLEAIGIDVYTPRRQLPGAAPSRSLPAPVARPLPPGEPRRSPPPGAEPRARRGNREGRDTARRSPEGPAPRQHAGELARFSLAVVFTGGVAWVEDLAGRPLAGEQVRLIHAMARALGAEPGVPRVAQFDWPVHNNRQLDLGLAAARDGVAAFLDRQMTEHACGALVLLGAECGRYVAAERFRDAAVIGTLGTLDMLRDPTCKRRVWLDLQALVRRP